MEKKEIEKKAQESKKIFTPHKKLTVRIKKDASNPFNSTVFKKFLEMQEQRPIYNLYIHLRDKYMSLSCPTCKELDTIKIPIDNKLWVELLCMFDIISEPEED